MAWVRPPGWGSVLAGVQPRVCTQLRVRKSGPQWRSGLPRRHPRGPLHQQLLKIWQVSAVSTRTFPSSKPYKVSPSFDPVIKPMAVSGRFDVTKVALHRLSEPCIRPTRLCLATNRGVPRILSGIPAQGVLGVRLVPTTLVEVWGPGWRRSNVPVRLWP